MKRLFVFFAFAICVLFANAAVSIKSVSGWFEAGYVTWSAMSGATNYNVYIAKDGTSDWTKLDNELVRKYPDYYRADAVGLKAGNYRFKVVPVVNGNESSSNAATSSVFTATAHDRSGFAHVGMSGGIGAYKNDGTLKSDAKVIYVYANNAKTVSTEVITSSKGSKTTAKGLQNIINLYQKGYDKTPLDIRIIGTIKDTDMDALLSTGEGLQVKGNTEYSEMPITFEGIGDDAAIHGFGILCRNCKSTEFRNFAIMLCIDDALSLDTGNSNVWIHNMDLFYGNAGSAADQAKGDGTVDIKGKSMNCTVSYNHFYDSGKCSLGGMKSETTDCWMTYHHNWFDHSDSRHPRIRTCFYHVYNNYFDGNSKYGTGVTMGGSAFVEANYYRNCKYPMLISLQGTDAEGDGTFSGESGGVIKAYNNRIVNAKKVQYYTNGQTDGKWDAVLVQSRDAAVSAVALSGGTSYNSAADAAARSAVPASAIDSPSQIPSIVRGSLGAGRMNHGDFKWTFLNSAQDENYKVISELKSALQSYKSTLVGFADGTSINNGGATSTVNGGDGKGVDQAKNDAHIPSWGASGEPSGGETGGGEVEPDQPEQPEDELSESTLESLVEEAIELKENATYTLTLGTDYSTSGNGAISFESSNSDVATISADGVITAVAEGTATITISQAEDDSYKAGTATITVSVSKEESGEIVDPVVPSDEVICYFTASTKSPSSGMVTVSGSYSNSKGSVTYKKTEYTDCVKMESSTQITITPTFACDITLYFVGDGKKVEVDGNSCEIDSNKKLVIEGNKNESITLKKVDVLNLFLIVFTPKSSEEPTYQTGDIDRDGSITINDAAALISILNGTSTDQFNNSDLNGDNNVDIQDLQRLIEILIGQ